VVGALAWRAAGGKVPLDARHAAAAGVAAFVVALVLLGWRERSR
jgi:hypothetical protein